MPLTVTSSRGDRARALKHRVAFEKRVASDDGYGNVEEGWEEQFAVAARIQPRFGGETVLAARLSGQQPVNITIRQSTQANEIRPDWRARDARKGTIYNIRSIADPDESCTWWEMLCQSGVAT